MNSVAVRCVGGEQGLRNIARDPGKVASEAQRMLQYRISKINF